MREVWGGKWEFLDREWGVVRNFNVVRGWIWVLRWDLGVGEVGLEGQN